MSQFPPTFITKKDHKVQTRQKRFFRKSFEHWTSPVYNVSEKEKNGTFSSHPFQTLARETVSGTSFAQGMIGEVEGRRGYERHPLRGNGSAFRNLPTSAFSNICLHTHIHLGPYSAQELPLLVIKHTNTQMILGQCSNSWELAPQLRSTHTQNAAW